MKKESYLKSKENEAAQRINFIFFQMKTQWLFFSLPIFTVLHLNKPLVLRIAEIPLSCKYLFRGGESWACSILLETQGKQNEIAVLQKTATLICTDRGESVARIKEGNNTDKSEDPKWY